MGAVMAGALGTAGQPQQGGLSSMRQVLWQGSGPLPAAAASPMLSMVTARAISVEGWSRATHGSVIKPCAWFLAAESF